MKAIMISIKPQFVADILNGKKTIEIRKTCPEIFKHLKPYEGCSIDVYIYCTKEKILGNLIKVGSKENAELFGNNSIVGINKGFMKQGDIDLQGKVVAKFTLNKVEEIHSYLEPEQWYKTNGTSGSDLMKKSCLTFGQLDAYLMGGWGYAWHIEDLEIFDRPRTLQPFFDLDRPPQSWFYIEV